MKRFLIFVLLFIGLYYILYNYKEEIMDYGSQFFYRQREVVVPAANVDKRNYDYLFVQNTIDFVPNDKQDLLNIFYTIFNSGWDEFTFYCTNEYPDCLGDLHNIANDQTLLSHVNNFVHPYNSYKEIKTKYDTLGTVTVSIIKTYDNETRKLIDDKVNAIMKEILKDNMTIEQKIRTIHDYIVNHTKYDSDRLNSGIIKYKSDTSYGVLFEGYGFCSGYADTMAIFLNKLNLNNYKIANEKHVWNLVYLNNKWYHIDVSWDDPVSSSGKDILDHTFFLIDTTKLKKLNVEDHQFDANIYLEI